MATYCFRCRVCERTATSAHTNWSVSCPCGREMTRDYRAESVGFNTATLARLRDAGGTEKSYAQNFLPSADDYKSPTDPDGQKGLRKWNDDHSPHSSASGRMIRPEPARKSW